MGASGLVGFPVSKAIETPVKDALNATGSAPVYACRAWVNFNGTGTVAIRASGNVSSITDNGTGDYTINFTNAMPDANYSVAQTNGISVSGDGWGTPVIRTSTALPQTTSVTLGCLSYSNWQDSAYITVAIFR